MIFCYLYLFLKWKTRFCETRLLKGCIGTVFCRTIATFWNTVVVFGLFFFTQCCEMLHLWQPSDFFTVTKWFSSKQSSLPLSDIGHWVRKSDFFIKQSCLWFKSLGVTWSFLIYTAEILLSTGKSCDDYSWCFPVIFFLSPMAAKTLELSCH